MHECIDLGVTHVWMHRAFGGGSVDQAAAELGRATRDHRDRRWLPVHVRPDRRRRPPRSSRPCARSPAPSRAGSPTRSRSRPDDVLERAPGRVPGAGLPGTAAGQPTRSTTCGRSSPVSTSSCSRRRVDSTSTTCDAGVIASPARVAPSQSALMVWPARSQAGTSSSTVQTATRTSSCGLARVARLWRGARSGSAGGAPRDGPTGRRSGRARPRHRLRSTQASLLGRRHRVGELALAGRLDQLLGTRRGRGVGEDRPPRRPRPTRRRRAGGRGPAAPARSRPRDGRSCGSPGPRAGRRPRR